MVTLCDYIDCKCKEYALPLLTKYKLNASILAIGASSSKLHSTL